MTKLKAVIHLDLFTVKPYMKSIVFLFAFGLFLNLSFTNASTSIYMYAMYVMLILSYPFAVGEQNSLDTLYASLSLKRREIVQGRYLLSVAAYFCVSLMAFATSIISIAMKKEVAWNEFLFSVSVCFIVFSFFASVQLPIYFKMGYSKGKILAMLPIILISAGFIASGMFIKDGSDLNASTDALFQLITANLALWFLGCAATGALILIISCFISIRFYEKREF